MEEAECRAEGYARHSALLQSFDVDHLGIFPKTVDVTKGRSEQRAGFFNLKRSGCRMMGVHRPLIRAVH